MDKIKVLIINVAKERFSVGKIAKSFCDELIVNGHQAELLYGMKFSNSKSENTVHISNKFEYFIHHCINVITGYHSEWAPFAMRRIRKAYAEFQPDIVQLYNIHGYYLDTFQLFDFLAEKNVPVVYGMLDEYPYLGYCAYAFECEQFKTGCTDCKSIKFRGYLGSLFFNRARETFLKKDRAYKKNNICFTGPKWVLERARQSALLKEARLYEIDEFVDTENTFIPRNGSDIRKKYGIKKDNILILNVAPSSDPRKGVQDFIYYAKKCNDKNIIFMNVGNQIKSDDLPEGYIGVPFVTNQIELSKYYSAADILFCTSYADTMPNVCLDALSCGTPVMGYKVTGVPYVAEEPLGTFFEPEDKDKIEEFIKTLNTKDEKVISSCREYALHRYSLSTYYNKQLAVYEEMLRSH